MKTIVTALAMIVLLSIAPAVGSVEQPPLSKIMGHGLDAKLVVEGSPIAHDGELAEWAHRRFASAGLHLPAVVVEFPTDPDRCGGNMGIAVHGEDRPRIVICADGASDTVVKRTLLHELAHVWADTQLDETTVARFLEFRDLEAWAEGRWGDRGSEHAAEIVTWALMDRELTMLTLEDHDPAGLAEGYRVLTGHEVPSGRTGFAG